MTNTIKGFFFDLDGTLVDTHESNFRAYNQAIREIKGIQLGHDLKKQIQTGTSSAEFLPNLIPSLEVHEIEAINRKKKEFYPDHLHVSRLNEYLSTFLAQMSEHYVTALVTTAKKPNAQAVLRAHDLEKYFSFMIFGEDVTAMKPHPEAYKLALRRSQLDANEVIAFEDSKKGIIAAHKAGIRTVHIKEF